MRRSREEKTIDSMPLPAWFLCLSCQWEVLSICIECPGRLTPSVVGFTVDPDQWCRHDRGQAWPGSNAPYWHLPHHLPRGGARPESTNGLSRSISGTSPLPSTPSTLRFPRPGRGRPLEPSGGWLPHRGMTSSAFQFLTSLRLLDCAAETSLKYSFVYLFGCCIFLNAVQFHRRWCMVWRLSLIQIVVLR